MNARVGVALRAARGVSGVRTIRTLATIALMAAAVAAPRLEAQQARPSLSAGRITGELLGGAYAGIGGFVIGRWVGQEVSNLFGVTSDDTRRRTGLVSGVLFAGLATAGTVYAIGNIGDETGEFDATYLGTGVGFVAGLGLARIALGPGERPREGSSTAARWAAANFIALLPALGATIAFNSSRRLR